MKIVVDHDLCETNGVCVSWAPEVFSVDDDGRLHLLVERPGAELWRKAADAVSRCPRGALSVVEGE